MVGACAPKGRAKFCGRCRYNSGTRTLLHTGTLSLFLSSVSVLSSYLFLSLLRRFSSLYDFPFSLSCFCIFLHLLYRRDRHGRPQSLLSPPPDSFHLRRLRCSCFDSSLLLSHPSPILLSLCILLLAVSFSLSLVPQPHLPLLSYTLFLPFHPSILLFSSLFLSLSFSAALLPRFFFSGCISPDLRCLTR